MRTSLVALALGLSSVALPSLARAADPGPATPGAAPDGAPAPAPSPALMQLTTMRDMHDRGLISDAEYRSAQHDMGNSTGDERASDALSLAIGRWSTTIYGFAEADAIYDTTQSFTDLAGNALVARGTAAQAPASQQTYAGTSPEGQISVRNSRFGVRIKPPGSENVRTSGMLEMDFLGAQSEGYGAGQVSQATYYQSPLMRIRHAMFRVETPIVDVLAGQYWHLFGWQGAYHPNTVEIQGLPGELYARTPQVRLSKTLKAYPVTVEIAVAAMRPPSAGSVTPEGVGGVRVALDSWKGMQTQGATSTSIAPLSVALTADYRHFAVPAIDSVVPNKTVGTSSTSLAADAFIPVLPASREKKDNALSLTGEVVYGGGIADLYTGLNGGLTFPTLPPAAGILTGNTWPQNIDNGLVNYDIQGFALHPVQWTTYMLGLQYYLPALDGRVWVSANYSHTQSRDSSLLGNYAATSDYARNGAPIPGATSYNYAQNAGQLRAGEDWWDVNVFYDPVPSVRVGAELAEFIDHYVDGYTASNVRAQVSGFFLF